MAHPTWHIGLTGGIGSGKSTVAAMLQAAGAVRIDADQLAHACTTHHGAAVGAIRAAFGDAFIDEQGSMRRHAMRDLVFAQPHARQQLEAIVHPIVQQQAQVLGQQAADQGKLLVIYEIPLLAESGHWRSRLHLVLVVDCDPETQIQRCMQRNGMTREQAQAIVATQASRKQRLHAADAAIWNGAGVDLGALQAQVASWARPFGLMIAQAH